MEEISNLHQSMKELRYELKIGDSKAPEDLSMDILEFLDYNISKLTKYLDKGTHIIDIDVKDTIPFLEKIKLQYLQDLEKEYYKGYLKGMINRINENDTRIS